jgi:uncharacterized protein (DUF58 family)
MPTSARTAPQSYIDPRVLARIGSLELVARTVVNGFVGGLHRAPTFGSTTDFAEHRAYMAGDDTRRVDWRLYARTDRLHVKEFEADTNTSVSVLLDVSRSMSYASTPGALSKLDYGRFLAASLLWLAQRQRDRVGLVTFDSAVREFVPPSAKHLYTEPRAAIDAVLQLRNRGNELILMHLLDPAELNFPLDEPGSLEDLESGETVAVVPETLRAEYTGLLAAHVAELTRLAAGHRVDYALFDTSKPLDTALAHFLAGRQRLARAR